MIASLEHTPSEPEMIESVPSQAEPQPEQPTQAEQLAQPVPQPEPLAEAEPVAQPEPKQPQTLTELLARVDDGWRQFRAMAGAFPSERMDERLNEGWTRKQMLAHVSAWHDLAHDRLGKLILTGESTQLSEKTDVINARVARQAIGRTAGEILKEMEMTFNRLRRQLVRLTDEQLAADDGWAASVIAGDTYEHYEEHWADVYMPVAADGRSGRR